MSNRIFLSESSVFWDVFHHHTVRDNPTFLASLHILLSVKLRETPLVGSHDLLSSRELELGTAKSFDDMVTVGIFGPHRHDEVANVDTGSHFHGFTVRPTHSRGQTICPGA